MLEFTGDDVNDFEGREYLEILLEEEENEKKKIKWGALNKIKNS